MPLLEAKHIGHTYDGVQAILKDVSFSLESGEALGVIGPNGGGKTTLLKILAGILRPTQGELLVEGKDVLKGSFPRQLFSYVAQHSEIDTVLPLTVEDMVLFGSLGEKRQGQRPLGEILELVGLSSKAHYRFATLSGGERQRTLLARALLCRPHILLLDEPTNGLDTTGQDQLLAVLKEAQRQYGMALVMIGHDIGQMVRFCDRMLCLNRSHHWHDRKEMLTPKVLESIYHCEFEHLMIHLDQGPREHASAEGHHSCEHGHGHEHDDKGGHK